jgi:hypothetical protein
MAKTHKKDPATWKIKRHRKGMEHADNCSTGYRRWFYSQIHHIVPVTCMQDGSIEGTLETKEQLSFIRKCLAITPWDINKGPNNVGLPIKRAYYLLKTEPAKKAWDKLPCHMVDHNIYIKEVSTKLFETIWSPLIDDRDECNIEPKSVLTQLRTASRNWRTFLRGRGSSHQGTKHCWEERLNIPDTWYIPFSMAPGTPPKRQAPPDVPDKMWKAIKQLVK